MTLLRSDDLVASRLPIKVNNKLIQQVEEKKVDAVRLILTNSSKAKPFARSPAFTALLAKGLICSRALITASLIRVTACL